MDLQTLKRMGWTCKQCSCPGKKGVDCVHQQHSGFIISLKNNRFSMKQRGHIIASGWMYEL